MRGVPDEFTLFREFAGRCQDFVHDILPIHASAYSNTEPESEADFVSKMISMSCVMSSESALYLVAARRLWDAEVLLRSVLEGSYKFVFLNIGDESARAERAAEFWHVLPEIHRLKTHLKIEKALADLQAAGVDVAANEWKSFRDLVISDAEITEIRSRLPKNQRRQLEDKWSFLPLAEELTKIFANEGMVFPVLAHGYSIGSHQAHKDGDGVGVVWDRALRSKDRFESIEIVHAVRIVSDIMAMAVFRLSVLFRLKNLDGSPVVQFRDRLSAFSESTEQYAEAWHRIEYQSQQ